MLYEKMDRFYWSEGSKFSLGPLEKHFRQQHDIRIYDGDVKTTFDSGVLNLTSHRLIWEDAQQQNRTINLDLGLVKSAESEAGGLFASAKIIVRLNPPPTNKPLGPKNSSPHSFIKLSFRSGGNEEFLRAFKDVLAKKEWEKLPPSADSGAKKGLDISHSRAGIGGIQRQMEEKHRQTDQTISEAFKDLDALMEKAKDMVFIAEKFSSKLKDKQISITDDETVAFKSYLLSMGIENPVTRETHGTGVKYHEELAKQLASFLSQLIEDEGGVMTLTDVYCRFNRARGMELVSPEDLVNAAKMFENLRIPLRLRVFDSGVQAIQSLSQREEELIAKTSELVGREGSLTSEELGRLLKITITLSRERLLMAEKAGNLCRDDSVEGLRFYPNKFLLNA